ncbi:TrmH family RNA methyltransferase [Candidatus Contubernalis alkaliaceticus]|uniref:TrmH family RNA methyltransferase n=1 Tax=Candidatus Contubernalis alkaliaceticus TaxID=338645 RepID=UPI001F4C1801|nr:RNA methyltransferase [Candidatus Contubernalis alkalaceticus]UNC92647.1 RNA methyltransferase [Candidatus Contubernalis alkalaceticus]
MALITSRQNPEVKLYTSLLKKKYRDKMGLIPLEGVRLIREALSCGIEFTSVLYSEELLKGLKGRELLQSISIGNPGVKTVYIAKGLLRETADTENPQGILAVVKKPDYNLSQISETEKPLVMVISGLQDPGNLGSMIRTASAACVSGVIVSRGTVDIFNPKTLRGTMGAIFHLPVIVIKDAMSIINYLRHCNIKIVVTDLEAEANCFQGDLTGPTAVVFGSEAFGVSDEFKVEADLRLKIPLLGAAESLNVSVSAGIIIYEAVRQRHFSSF